MFKATLACLLFLLFFLTDTALCAGQVTTFIYHRFDETRYPSTNISSEIFTQQLTLLKEQNYQVLSLGEVARRLAAGEALPEKGAAICIDDAFTSFVEVGMPIIRQFGFPVTLFVNTDAVGSRGYLSWKQLQQLAEEGVEIGNHTATHDYLVELQEGENLAAWKLRVMRDIDKSKQLYEKHIGTVAQIFAYPYGEYNSELMQMLEDGGFVAAFAQQSGVIHSQSNRFALPRFPMGGPYATLAGFKNKLSMKPLLVTQEEPVSPLVIDNPPVLKLKITDEAADLRLINCFAQGDNSCTAEPIAGQPGWFQVTAEKPLVGRRNKYTLTVQGKRGGWHWYSHLWVRAKSPAGGAAEIGEGLPVDSQVDRSEAGQSILTDQRL